MIECKFAAIICPSPDREPYTFLHSPSENLPVIASIHTEVRGWVGVRSGLAGALDWVAGIWLWMWAGCGGGVGGVHKMGFKRPGLDFGGGLGAYHGHARGVDVLPVDHFFTTGTHVGPASLDLGANALLMQQLKESVLEIPNYYPAITSTQCLPFQMDSTCPPCYSSLMAAQEYTDTKFHHKRVQADHHHQVYTHPAVTMSKAGPQGAHYNPPVEVQVVPPNSNIVHTAPMALPYEVQPLLRGEGALRDPGARAYKKARKGCKTRDPQFEQAEHIRRERLRRDDMTHKYSVLESILPSGPKRDRSTIVEDSIAYVKNLHHRMKQLQERKVAMTELAGRARLAQSPQQTTSTLFLYPQLNENLLSRMRLDSSSASTKEDLNKFHEFFGNCVTRLHLHSDNSVPHKFSIEMLCRPQPCLQSQIFLCFESLFLEVKQCTITTVRNFVMCVILAQAREESNYAGSVSGLVTRLRYALGSNQPK